MVQELGLEPGVDTLSRWIAHYVAEQIAIAETIAGSEKIEAEQQCFDTILKLWEHRASLPNHRYPFKNFEPIFQTLTRLDPENSIPYYFDNSYFQETENNDVTENRNNEIQLWLDLALSIDSAARVLIEFALEQAAYNAEDGQTTTWIEKSTGIPDSEYNALSLIVRFTGQSQERNPEENCEQNRHELTLRIEKLEMFIEFSKLLHDELTECLESISDEDYNTEV